MTREVPTHLRRLVIKRAKSRCEYCGLWQEGQEATFHVDHVIPRATGGATSAENLALACVSCSLRKAARRTAADPLALHPTSHGTHTMEIDPALIVFVRCLSIPLHDLLDVLSYHPDSVA